MYRQHSVFSSSDVGIGLATNLDKLNFHSCFYKKNPSDSGFYQRLTCGN
jgi:hypothetical protein